jgi:hypothetical protein
MAGVRAFVRCAVVVLVASTGVFAIAAPASATTTVPISGSIVGTVSYPSVVPAECDAFPTYVFSWDLPPLGATDVSFAHCLDIAPFGVAQPVSGPFAVTTAIGTLTGTFSGTVDPVSAAEIDLHLSFMTSSGTGGLSAVSASFTLDGFSEFVHPHPRATLSGDVMVPDGSDLMVPTSTATPAPAPTGLQPTVNVFGWADFYVQGRRVGGLFPPSVRCWNAQGALVGLDAADDPGGSGVASETYQATGIAVIPTTTVSGPTAQVAVASRRSRRGLTTLRYSAMDNAGNQEPVRSLTILTSRIRDSRRWTCAVPTPTTFTVAVHGKVVLHVEGPTNNVIDYTIVY